MSKKYPLLGIGLYSPTTAALYLGLPREKVKRWRETVTGQEIPELAEHGGISFLGLMELLAVKRFREKGASLKDIRLLTASVEGPHPLAHRQFHEGDARLEWEGDWPVRFWPLGRGRNLRLDPAVSFGKPIVHCGVPTYVLAGMVLKAGETVAAVADWYVVPVPDVEAAVEYERGLQRRESAGRMR